MPSTTCLGHKEVLGKSGADVGNGLLQAGIIGMRMGGSSTSHVSGQQEHGRLWILSIAGHVPQNGKLREMPKLLWEIPKPMREMP